MSRASVLEEVVATEVIFPPVCNGDPTVVARARGDPPAAATETKSKKRTQTHERGGVGATTAITTKKRKRTATRALFEEIAGEGPAGSTGLAGGPCGGRLCGDFSWLEDIVCCQTLKGSSVLIGWRQ